MKLFWDSQYVGLKKKTAEEREASRNEFSMPKEKKSNSQPTTFLTSTTQSRTTTETPLNTNMFEECHAEKYEQELDEPYEPVEAYAGVPANVKMIVYALTCYTALRAAAAFHEPLEDEHGRWKICTFLTILVMLLFCLAYAFGYRRGLRAQRARQRMTLDDAYARLDRLQDRNDRHDRHDEETEQLRARLQALEVGHERDLLLGERRAGNVMSIMMESQLRQLTFMTGRIDRLCSLIINNQPPCPVGDSILVQENMDGAK